MTTLSANNKKRTWALVLVASVIALGSIFVAHRIWGRYGGIGAAVAWVVFASVLELIGQFRDTLKPAAQAPGIEVGSSCTVISGFDGSSAGFVDVSGEKWAASAADELSAKARLGDSVDIVGRHGLTLLIRCGANDT